MMQNYETIVVPLTAKPLFMHVKPNIMQVTPPSAPFSPSGISCPDNSPPSFASCSTKPIILDNFVQQFTPDQE